MKMVWCLPKLWKSKGKHMMQMREKKKFSEELWFSIWYACLFCMNLFSFYWVTFFSCFHFNGRRHIGNRQIESGLETYQVSHSSFFCIHQNVCIEYVTPSNEYVTVDLFLLKYVNWNISYVCWKYGKYWWDRLFTLNKYKRERDMCVLYVYLV